MSSENRAALNARPRIVAGHRRLVAVAVACLATARVLASGNDYHLLLASQFAAFVIAAVSLNLIFGYAHQAVLAQGALVGIGAYGFALGVRGGLPVVVAGVVAIAASALAGGVLALPTLRWKGLSLAIVSLAFQFAFTGMLEAWTDVTGGRTGREVAALRDTELFGLDNDETWFLISAASAILVVALSARMLRTVAGRVLAGLREAAPAAQAQGARPFTWNLATFVLSGGLAGLAGVLLCGQTAFVSPGSFSLHQTILYTLGVIIGGVASIGGSVLGAVFIVGLPELLATWDVASWQPALTAAAALVALILLPEGLVTAPVRLARLVRRRTTGPGGDVRPPTVASRAPQLRDSRNGDGPHDGPVPLLEVRQLMTGYGRVVIVRGVDLLLHRGEVVALIGANGAGKSTLLRALAGLNRISSGAVLLEGRSVTGVATPELARAGLSYVPPDRSLHEGLTVREHLELGGITLPKHVAAERIAELEERYPLLRDGGVRVAELSGGQKQLLAISRALMIKPRVLLLDEPSMGLSPALVDDVMATVADLRSTGVGVIAVEQNVRAALAVSDRCVLLENGIVRRDEPSEVFRAKGDRVAEELIGTITPAAVR